MTKENKRMWHIILLAFALSVGFQIGNYSGRKAGYYAGYKDAFLNRSDSIYAEADSLRHRAIRLSKEYERRVADFTSKADSITVTTTTYTLKRK